jgi:hypothetical protein
VLAAIVIAAVSAGVTAIALGGGDDDPDSAAEDDAATESASDATEAPTTTVELDTPTTTAAPSTTALPSTTATVPPADNAEFPPEAPLGHGGTTWALYLAISDDPEDPVLEAARQSATDAGYLSEQAGGSLGCDEGAPEALNASTDTMAVAVYFATQAEAEQARTAFASRGQDAVDIVEVTNYCLD